jgi:hypothetical protein
MSDAERQRLCRQRKREAASSGANGAKATDIDLPVTEAPAIVTDLPVTAAEPVTANPDILNQKCPGRNVAGLALTAAAIGLAGTGLTMNGWFARSLGSTDFSGWLFLAVGVAADCAALVLPSSPPPHGPPPGAAFLWPAGLHGS